MMSKMPQDNLLKAEKRKKLHALKKAGINPYPYSFEKDLSSKNFIEKYNNLESGQKVLNVSFKMVGRVMSKRLMGKAAFFHIQDQEGQLQCYLKVQQLPQTDQVHFEHLDIGDIVGLSGFPFKTKTGEISLHCQSFQIICKSLESLPEKFHGLTDIETKYRLRHLHLIVDQKAKNVFKNRALIIQEIRSFLNKRGFIEVETPILQPIYGGALAHPFVTKHRSLNMNLYMKISPEIYLKRLIVGGFEKVYDLNKNFRNEGIDRSHNPEFTMLEWYEAYTDYIYQMKQFEQLICHVVRKLKGSEKITYQGQDIDFATPWKRMTVDEAIYKYGKWDVTDMSQRDLFKLCKDQGSLLQEPLSKGELIMELFELTCEKQIWDPTFITDHPIEVSPLTKVHRKTPGRVERFEPIVAGMEIGNAYSELNDPEDQLQRLSKKDGLADQRREEADHFTQHPIDMDFIHAIEVGMPPTGGVGLGIDRLVMLFTDSSSIRDVILFPTMKVISNEEFYNQLSSSQIDDS